MQVRQITLERAKKLRRSMSRPEIKLWLCLRRQQLDGLKFRRQHPAGPWILDFYCDEAKLAVEIDGEGHGFGNRPQLDERRDEWLAERGIRTLRFPATSVMGEIDGVLETIRLTARA